MTSQELSKMLDFKQLHRKKLKTSKHSNKGKILGSETLPVLVRKLLPDKQDREEIQAQARGNPKLVDFLLTNLEDDIVTYSMTNTYDYERAYLDGKAHEAYRIWTILKGLLND